MMKHLNRLILFVAFSLILPGSAHALDTTSQSSNVFKFQQKLANNGNARAQYKLATMYEAGSGTAQSIEQAKHWYSRASAAGITAANDRMTYLVLKEQGYDQAKNAAWLNNIKKEANRSNGDAMFLLAQLYRTGLGVDKDLHKSLEFLDKVSLLGAADVDDEVVMIQAEIEADKRAEATALRKTEAEAARLVQQNAEQQVVKQQQIVQQEEMAKVNQAEKIRRYEEVMMQLQLEQQQIDKQQAWASGSAAASMDDEF